MTDCNDFGVTFSPQKCLSQTFYPNSPLLSFLKINKNNQKVRVESIDDIKKHFQNNDQETLVPSNGSNIIYTLIYCNIDIIIILLRLHLLLSNGYF